MKPLRYDWAQDPVSDEYLVIDTHTQTIVARAKTLEWAQELAIQKNTAEINRQEAEDDKINPIERERSLEALRIRKFGGRRPAPSPRPLTSQPPPLSTMASRATELALGSILESDPYPNPTPAKEKPCKGNLEVYWRNHIGYGGWG